MQATPRAEQAEVGIAVADLTGNGSLSVLVSTYVGTVIFDVSSAIKEIL